MHDESAQLLDYTAKFFNSFHCFIFLIWTPPQKFLAAALCSTYINLEIKMIEAIEECLRNMLNEKEVSFSVTSQERSHKLVNAYLIFKVLNVLWER